MAAMKTYLEDMKNLVRDCKTADQAWISVMVNYAVNMDLETIERWRSEA